MDLLKINFINGCLIDDIQGKFSTIASNGLKSLMSVSKIENFKKDEFIYMEQDPVRYYYFILNGKVELFRYTDKNTKQIFFILTDNDEFSISELFYSEDGHVLNSRAIEDTRVLKISKDHYFSYIESDKSLLYQCLNFASRIIRNLHFKLCITSSETKVLTYLNSFIIEKPGNEEVIVVPRIDNDEKIAEILGLVRETVNRILKKFEKQGVIKVTKRSFHILKKDFFLNSSKEKFNYLIK